MLILDHLLFLVLALVHPVAGYISFRRLLRRIEAGEHVARTTIYDSTMLGQWLLFGLTMAIWAGTGRDWASLGLGGALDGRFFAGVILALIAIGLLIMQVKQIAIATTDELKHTRTQLGKLEFIIPRNGKELGRFYGLSLTAGIVEEVLWRGFMIWYLNQFMPLWGAAVLSTIGFAAAHAYQGAANVPRITLVGAVFAGLYLLTGSVWVSIVLHAAVDVLQGRTAYEVLSRLEQESDEGQTVGT
jgi:membrane protease YdiL (CAAX protease family)